MGARYELVADHDWPCSGDQMVVTTVPCPKCAGSGRIPASKDRTRGRYAKARELRKQGLTVREIAKRLGYKSTCSVAAALKQGN